MSRLSPESFVAMVELLDENGQSEKAKRKCRLRLEALLLADDYEIEVHDGSVNVYVGGLQNHGSYEFHALLDYEFTPMGTVDAPTEDPWFIHEPSDIEVQVNVPEVEAVACAELVDANYEEGPAEAARAEYRRTRL